MNRTAKLICLLSGLVILSVVFVLRSGDAQHRASRMNTRENATMTVTVDLPKTNSAKAVPSSGTK